MNKPSWRERARRLGRRYQPHILRIYPDATATRSPTGFGPDHCLFMAGELAKPDGEGMVDGDTKACRWLGWLQNELCHIGVLSLDDCKQDNLNSGREDFDAVQ